MYIVMNQTDAPVVVFGVYVLCACNLGNYGHVASFTFCKGFSLPYNVFVC